MHIGINALILRQGEYSGVHVAVRGMLSALVDSAGANDRFTVYVQRNMPDGLPPESEQVRYVRPLWPVGWRTGRVTYEQFRLYQRVFEDQLDLFHCPAYVMPRWCLMPTVVSVHDLFGLTMPQLCTRSGRSHLSRMLPVALERARRVIVPSEWVKHEILAWDQPRGTRIEGLEEKIRVIPWGVDERFKPLTDKAELERVSLAYGLPPNYVLFVGRIEPKKNVARLVQAYFAATVAKKLPHRLVIAGPKGWGANAEVQKMVKDLGLTEKVVFTGFVPDNDMAALYTGASAVLFPSFAEGFGLPVLEAQACGTPVICGDIPALKEVSGGAARFAQPADLPALRVALEDVLTDDALAEDLRTRGHENVRQYTWRAHAEATLALYREVVAKDRAGG